MTTTILSTKKSKTSGNAVVPMRGTVKYSDTMAGYQWHCPIAGCIANGGWVKEQLAAIRGLAAHAMECHADCRRS